MRRLSKLTAGKSLWRLPLSEHAACRLLEAFSHHDAASRQSHLAALLADEPPLALWCVCRRPPSADPPESIESLARWLAVHGLHVLQWGEDEPQPTPAVDRKQLHRWADLAGWSVEAAHRASHSADADDSRQVYLFALLHRALDWLGSSGPTVSLDDCRAENTCLPQWLVQFLRQLRDAPTSTACLRAVAGAVDHQHLDPGDGPAKDDQQENGDTAGEHARRVRRHWLKPEVSVGDVLPVLLARLDRLRELEEDFQKALETEKLESLKALAYGASHEINNPLANISTRAQTLLREETDPERRRKLAVINAQAFRGYELIADMMLFARPPELQLSPTDLTALVDEVIAEMALEAREQGTVVRRTTPDEPVTASVDGNHLAVALRALCRNSLEAIGSGGRVEIAVGPCDPPVNSDGGPWVAIQVSDTGPGISAEARGHLFDPYYSGREAGRGLGLGLSKSWRIVDEHGGRIDVESQPEQGAVFAVRLPRDGRS